MIATLVPDAEGGGVRLRAPAGLVDVLRGYLTGLGQAERLRTRILRPPNCVGPRTMGPLCHHLRPDPTVDQSTAPQRCWGRQLGVGIRVPTGCRSGLCRACVTQNSVARRAVIPRTDGLEQITSRQSAGFRTSNWTSRPRA